MEHHRVAVTGLGAISSAGIALEQTWKALRDGISCVDRLTRFDVSDFPCQIGGEVREFDPRLFMDPRTARRNGLATQLAISAASLAIEDSQLDLRAVNKDRVGVVVGSSVGNLGFAEEQYHIILEKGIRRVSPFALTATHPSSFSGHISVVYGFHGPTETVHTACSSGASAIGLAYRYIKHGLADVVLAGGAEAPITRHILGSFCMSKGLMSRRNDNPTSSMRPFSADRDGLALAEASAILVLEDYERAKASGRTIYSELTGYGTTSDGFHRMVQAPDGVQYTRAITLALEDADLPPDEIDYVIPHASATPKNDPAESSVIALALGTHSREIPISAIKPITGHSLGACGAIEAVAMNLALQEQVALPTINYSEKDPLCELDYCPNIARPVRMRNGLSINCGFGGVNTALLFSLPED
jgi:3-oxoacyl-(acyl-carrier-protein) synthase